MTDDDHTLDVTTARQVTQILADRLTSLLDLQLTLKHVHWNVVGSNFLSVHHLLDSQVEQVRAMSDTLAERIAALGGTPLGTPAAIVEQRRWPDYKINRAPAQAHLSELDSVYSGIIGDHRRTLHTLGELDLVSQDILLGQTAHLEMFRWMARAQLARDTELEQAVRTT
jgi:starvation-inducible DNA-binding protein